MNVKSIQIFIIIKIQNEVFYCICLSITVIDCVLKMFKTIIHQYFRKDEFAVK